MPYLRLLFLIAASAATAASTEVGPLLGTVDATSAHFLYRPAASGITNLRLSVFTANGKQPVATCESQSLAENDWVAKFWIANLKPSNHYRYIIESADDNKPLTGPHDFQTTADPVLKSRTTAVFVSCADSAAEPLWPAVAELNPDYLFLMGDTPYIDTDDLAKIRRKHAAFLQIPSLQALIRSTPTVGVWDDHDFGANNGNGHSFAHGKAKTRQGFTEYRAHAQYGDGSGGVYHSIKLGAVDVFLLDPRWFSQTEPSPVDPKQRSCFGKEQWQWLLRELQQSTATFKALAMGAIWQHKKGSETDDMHTYWYERDALFDFIRDAGIAGVCLLGGDIHLSRHLIHPLRVDYDLQDFIISPGHGRTIKSLDVYNPNLEWSLVKPHQFLAMTADTTATPATLTVEFRQPGDVVNRRVVLTIDDLTPRETAGPRAEWHFDTLANDSPLGRRVDLIAKNGASLVDGGISGKALRLERANSQYAYAPRSVLYENSASHSIALWCRPESLPAHGSPDRHFLFENTKTGEPSTVGSWNLSCGFRSSDTPQQVNLQLHSYVLQTASKIGAAPKAVPQGPFNFAIDRTRLLQRWTHVAVAFDSTQLVLYLNGKEAARHDLPVSGPSSEQGGLVLGGHRAGVGRNFDGLLDEVGIWSRVLANHEVRALHDQFRKAPIR
jgi:hypothetical protein